VPRDLATAGKPRTAEGGTAKPAAACVKELEKENAALKQLAKQAGKVYLVHVYVDGPDCDEPLDDVSGTFAAASVANLCALDEFGNYGHHSAEACEKAEALLETQALADLHMEKRHRSPTRGATSKYTCGSRSALRRREKQILGTRRSACPR